MPVIAKHVESLGLSDTVVVSPDVGNVKQANAYAERLGTGMAVIEKRRLTGDVTRASRVIGDVAGKTVFMFDDMITTGGTATEAVKILRNHGAKRFLMAATHAVMAGQAVERLAEAKLDWICVTDTIPLRPGVKERLPQVQVLSVASLLGEAIRRIHCNESVSALFSDGCVTRGSI
jgi:ribose-phosphate pyrophosphokinase